MNSDSHPNSINDYKYLSFYIDYLLNNQQQQQQQQQQSSSAYGS